MEISKSVRVVSFYRAQNKFMAWTTITYIRIYGGLIFRCDTSEICRIIRKMGSLTSIRPNFPDSRFQNFRPTKAVVSVDPLPPLDEMSTPSAVYMRWVPRGQLNLIHPSSVSLLSTVSSWRYWGGIAWDADDFSAFSLSPWPPHRYTTGGLPTVLCLYVLGSRVPNCASRASLELMSTKIRTLICSNQSVIRLVG